MARKRRRRGSRAGLERPRGRARPRRQQTQVWAGVRDRPQGSGHQTRARRARRRGRVSPHTLHAARPAETRRSRRTERVQAKPALPPDHVRSPAESHHPLKWRRPAPHPHPRWRSRVGARHSCRLNTWPGEADAPVESGRSFRSPPSPVEASPHRALAEPPANPDLPPPPPNWVKTRPHPAPQMAQLPAPPHGFIRQKSAQRRFLDR